MKKRIRKKRNKVLLEWFTKEKIPLAFPSEEDRKRWVSAAARRSIGQRFKFPEIAE